MPRPGSLGKSLLRMAFGPGRLSEYYYYYYYYYFYLYFLPYALHEKYLS